MPYMKRVELVVLGLVVLAAVFALYLLITEKGMTGRAVCDPYERSDCYYAPYDACCFTVVYYDGTKMEHCFNSYKFAVTTYKKYYWSDSLKTNSDFRYVSGIREGPNCIH